MGDIDVAIAVRSALLQLLAAQGKPEILVVQSNQPTDQGRVDAPVIYYFALPENLYGWQGRSEKFNVATRQVTREERQWIRSSFQVGALAQEDPNDLTKPTAKDLTRLAAMLINSAGFRQLLRPSGIGLERVTQIRNMPFQNDQGQFEYSPSFDFTVCWQQRIIQQSQGIDAAEYNITRV